VADLIETFIDVTGVNGVCDVIVKVCFHLPWVEECFGFEGLVVVCLYIFDASSPSVIFTLYGIVVVVVGKRRVVLYFRVGTWCHIRSTVAALMPIFVLVLYCIVFS